MMGVAMFMVLIFIMPLVAGAKNLQVGEHRCTGEVMKVYEQPSERKLRLYVKGMSVTKNTDTPLTVEPLVRSERYEAEALGLPVVGSHPYQIDTPHQTLVFVFIPAIMIIPGDALEVRCTGEKASITFHSCEGLTPECKPIGGLQWLFERY